jgi:hypothetical protein
LRFQFPLYKLFLILAVWAAALGALVRFGIMGIAIAALLGAECSLLIIAIRDRKALVSAFIVATGSMIGVIFASGLLPAPISSSRHDATDYIGELVIVSVGAVIGGVFFSWASKR